VRVERLKEEYPVEVTWVPFYLHPNLPPEGVPREVLFPGPPDEAYRKHLKESAAAVGIEMRRNPIIANSQKALEAAEFAREAGRLDDFGPAMFKAYFTDAKNIGLPEVLVEVARETGLDPDALEAALEDGRYATVVKDGSDWAHAVGVTGVPTFIFARKMAIVGAHPYESFERVMAELGVAKRGGTGDGG
jgi:predicted DsbA family dithiol-disulfide isomerase